MKKNLVYYCVGEEKEYVEMLKFSIFTLKNKNLELDILVITNDKSLEEKNKIKDVYFFHVNDDNPKKLKTKIFQYPNLDEYSKIIYLDCDTVINTFMDQLFNSMVDKNKLYVPIEHFTFESHNLPHFGIEKYTEDDINFFMNNNVYPFNSGTFGFFNTNEMKENFENVNLLINQNYGKSKYIDQPYFNLFFNNKLSTIYSVFETNKNYFFIDSCNTLVNYLDNFDGIYHFYSYCSSISDKLKTMIIFYFINKK